MLNYLLEGIRAGLVLSVLVGPILVLLLQLSLRRGTYLAFVGATGIWAADLTYILLSHYGMAYLTPYLEHVYFAEVVGTVGMFILIGIAAIMWYRKPIIIDDEERPLRTRRSVLGAFLQGFAVNAFNPFTIGFWSFLSITQVHDRGLDSSAAWAIYAGILGTVILTDSLKVVSAKKLRDLLRPEIVLKIQRVGALALGVFGLVLGIRVWW
ncbi:LysE family translocator [Neolewinella antarctica]|uniref:Threonine/homoserine/homoserine lactone efflux protein n=1 Tax=Neolewinella antarctica TaxID=442734 RepID=A0ABX0XD28_9BACT|nr:LysE family transporter [Neolewinella antarctica]NJC27203.1 threonine/homoserine/homoserine lactone efflux protein [Neolewinella antarctica]